MSDHPYQYGSQQGNQPASSGGFGSAPPPSAGGYGANVPGQNNPSSGSTYGSPSDTGSSYGSASPYGSSSGFGAPPTSGGFGSPPSGSGGFNPGTPEPKPGTNGFSIASLICGLLAPCGAGLLSVIFGAVALSQIKKTGQKGRGLAIAGFIATGSWILILALVVTLAIIFGENASDTPDRDTGGITGSDVTDNDTDDTNGGNDGGGDDTDPTEVDVYSLQIGDCLNDLSGTQFATLPVVPCSEPHEGEVYALFDISGNQYPGQDAVLEEAQIGCVDALDRYAPSAATDSNVDIFYLYPTEGTWAAGDREVVCVTYYLDGPRTGSIAG